jgi:hypothetical protein
MVRSRLLPALTRVLVLACTCALLVPATASAAGRVVPVSFAVVNDNTSAVPCSADGGKYTIAGKLFLPPGPVPSGVTVYVHGLGFAGYFWDFTAVPSYDYAATEAGAGHASLVIDRLGYGASSIPSGSASCVGSQATVLHEIVGDLRSGAYATGGPPAPSFVRVGIVGHSAGGQLAEVEAYSFRDVAALGIVDWADQGYSPGAYAAFGGDGVQCVLGTGKQVGSSSTGYAAFGQTAAEYDALMFADADPAVVAAANGLRELDPCGQVESVLTAVALDVARVGTISVPIAFVHGTEDAIFVTGLPWSQLQEALYLSSPQVTDITLAGEGHAVTLEQSAASLDRAMSSWLSANGL